VLDHIILTVSDFERSVAFYAKALKPLGITNVLDYEGQDGHPDLKGLQTLPANDRSAEQIATVFSLGATLGGLYRPPIRMTGENCSIRQILLEIRHLLDIAGVSSPIFAEYRMYLNGSQF